MAENVVQPSMVSGAVGAAESTPRWWPTQPLVPALNPKVAPRLFVLSDAALKNGIHLVAGPGSGKSRLMGRLLVWQMLLRGKPQVVLDPMGGVVSNVLDKISQLPPAFRRQLWPRLRYINVGATDHVVPAPLYHRVGAHDTEFAVANRLLALIKRQDPQLQAAPILGWNSLYECGLYAGQIATALDRQIDFVADLVLHPRQHKETLRQVLLSHPWLQPAVDYFCEMMDPTSGDLRARRTGSFVNKLLPFLADPTMLATFGAWNRRVDWEQVVREGQTVLIDFRQEQDPDRRRFKLLYWFRDFIEYIKYRGMAGRGQEVLYLIDEVTQLLGDRTLGGQSVMAEDLEEAVAVYGRGGGVNLVIGHQNLSQCDERITNVLLQMGTQVIGVIKNQADALLLAQQVVPYRPYWVKQKEPIWMNLEQFDASGFSLQYSAPEVVDHRAVYFALQEQDRMAAQAFQQLKRFEFIVRAAQGEGELSGQLHRISLANLDKNQYPEEATLAPLRRLLTQRDGVPLETLLAEMQADQGRGHTQKPTNPGRNRGTMEGKLPPTHDLPDHLPSAADTTRPVSPPREPEEEDHVAVWQ